MKIRNFDRYGKLLSVSQTERDYNDNRPSLPTLDTMVPKFSSPVERIITIAIIALLPVLCGAAYLFWYLHYTMHWHPAVSGLAATVPVAVAGVLIWYSRVFRIIYFSLFTIAVTFVVFIFAKAAFDVVWAGFAAAAAFIAGAIFVWFLVRN